MWGYTFTLCCAVTWSSWVGWVGAFVHERKGVSPADYVMYALRQQACCIMNKQPFVLASSGQAYATLRVAVVPFFPRRPHQQPLSCGSFVCGEEEECCNGLGGCAALSCPVRPWHAHLLLSHTLAARAVMHKRVVCCCSCCCCCCF